MDTLAGASGHRSPRRDAEPITAPFPQALIDAFRARPEPPAFEHRSRVLSRGEVLELIGRCADGLRAAGLGPGRSVAVATDVTPEGFALLVAAYALGCRVTGLRPGMSPPIWCTSFPTESTSWWPTRPVPPPNCWTRRVG
ncbi:AMP-binding protein [Streptomyces indonesiensis]